jgi:hypothetical protein
MKKRAVLKLVGGGGYVEELGEVAKGRRRGRPLGQGFADGLDRGHRRVVGVDGAEGRVAAAAAAAVGVGEAGVGAAVVLGIGVAACGWEVVARQFGVGGEGARLAWRWGLLLVFGG